MKLYGGTFGWKGPSIKQYVLGIFIALFSCWKKHFRMQTAYKCMQKRFPFYSVAYIGGWFLVSLGFEQTVCPQLSSGIHIFICHLNLQRKFSSIPHIHGYRKCSSINSWNLPFSLLLEAADDSVTMCSGRAFTPIHLQGCTGSHIYTLSAPSINFKLNQRDSFFSLSKAETKKSSRDRQLPIWHIPFILYATTTSKQQKGKLCSLSKPETSIRWKAIWYLNYSSPYLWD